MLCAKTGLLCLGSRSWQRVKISEFFYMGGLVIFSEQPTFVTKLGVVVHHHEPNGSAVNQMVVQHHEANGAAS